MSSSTERASVRSAQACTNRSSERPLAAVVPCSRCNEPNPAGRRYCTKCGSRLWDPCLSCGSANPTEERFCGDCGADLVALVHQRTQQLEETLAAAEQMAVSGRYPAALEQLQAIEHRDHSRLRPLLAEITDRTQRYPQEYQRAVTDANVAAMEARALLAAHRVDAAHARLGRVPPALHNAEIKKLADEVASLHTEASRLRGFIAAALREKKHSGLLPLVERYLELNGDDGKVADLLVQLRTRQSRVEQRTAAGLIAQAQKAVAACDYGAALAAVDRIPAGELAGDVKAVVQQVRERAWLFDRLQTETHVSPTLLHVCQRLAKLQPSDPRVEKLGRELGRRSAQHGAAVTRTAWAKASDDSALGIAVDLAPAPAELAASQPERPELAASLVTAYGLAIQAAGKATHALDLCPDDRAESWLGRVGSLALRKTAGSWGLDVGSSALKAVRLSPGGERPSVQQSLVIPYLTKRSDGADVEALRRETISVFLKQHDLSGCTIALNLPGTHTLGRFFYMPVPRRGRFDDAVKYEVRARLPLSEEQCIFDYETSETEPTDDAPTTPRRRIMLVAGSREHLCRVMQPWRDSGAAQTIIQSEGLALANAMNHSAPPHLSGCALLELGAQTANLAAFTPGGAWFRGLYAGAASLDHAVAARLGVTNAEAESLRRHPERAKFMHEVDEALKEPFAAIAEAIRRGLRQLHHDTGAKPTRLLLCGGGAYQFGLLRYLRLGK